MSDPQLDYAIMLSGWALDSLGYQERDRTRNLVMLLAALREIARVWEVDYTEADALAYRTVLNREDRSPWASLRTSD